MAIFDDRNLEIKLSLDDRELLADLNKSIGRAASEMDSGSKKMVQSLVDVQAAMNMIGSGARVMAGIMKEVYSEFEESEKVNRRLGAVLQSTGYAAGLTSKQIDTMASEFQDLTGVEDDLIKSSMTVLATFRNIQGDAFKKATQAALDMSAVMGQDLQSSIVQIGKALNEPIEGVAALRRAGVQLTDNQKEQIRVFMESGEVMKAQGVILNELQLEFAGAAAASKTLTMALSVEWQNAKEEMGGAAASLMGFLSAAVGSDAKDAGSIIKDYAAGWREIANFLREAGSGAKFFRDLIAKSGGLGQLFTPGGAGVMNLAAGMTANWQEAQREAARRIIAEGLDEREKSRLQEALAAHMAGQPPLLPVKLKDVDIDEVRKARTRTQKIINEQFKGELEPLVLPIQIEGLEGPTAGDTTMQDLAAAEESLEAIRQMQSALSTLRDMNVDFLYSMNYIDEGAKKYIDAMYMMRDAAARFKQMQTDLGKNFTNTDQFYFWASALGQAAMKAAEGNDKAQRRIAQVMAAIEIAYMWSAIAKRDYGQAAQHAVAAYSFANAARMSGGGGASSASAGMGGGGGGYAGGGGGGGVDKAGTGVWHGDVSSVSDASIGRGQSVTVINVVDRESYLRLMGSEDGRKSIVNTVSLDYNQNGQTRQVIRGGR